MAYGDFKDLTRRRAPDKILRDKAFNVAKNPMDINADFLQMAINVLVKKTSGSGTENENISNQRSLDLVTRELAEELHKSIIRELKKRNVNSPFIDNIWGADLADMQLTNRFNKGICFLLHLLIFLVNTHHKLFL